MAKYDVLIKCWGENIERNGIVAKRYLSYIIVKEQFAAINKYYKENLNKFIYAEVILDQESNETTLDFYSNNGEEKITRTTWHKSTFYKIIANIEEQ